ncbi:glutamate racemase [Xylanibacillus composti]|uniref:Glutamate racemase n=1 Tax=Xylanibacillus composti TaxID=1572762 RepID=A0A8J4H3K1_9BACL|nr:glutamate racemase [Xylanibacillus composti]MDT9724211.1 glutamate racemase [Xylanibacillus composti]GIQ68274.1 glutamate racemase 2 [Xylanibacillus composti]
MSIVFFDSGIGGLTVLHEAVRLMPHEDYIYYADSRHVPYGLRDKREVQRLVCDAIQAMTERYDVHAVVVACNTATSIAIQALRDRYRMPVIGMEPAVKPAVRLVQASRKRVLVSATPLTLKENKFAELVAGIEAEQFVDPLALPELVRFAEKEQFAGQTVEAYLREVLTPFDLSQYGAFVMGCTHYIYYKNLFSKLLPEEVALIDGNRGTVRHLQRQLEVLLPGRSGKGSGQIRFHSSLPADEADRMTRIFHHLQAEHDGVT